MNPTDEPISADEVKPGDALSTAYQAAKKERQPIIIPNNQIEARIRLRGDNDVHLLRVKAEELDPHSEGACGLQGEIHGFTGDPITCEGCIRWLERHAVEVGHSALNIAKAIQADADRILGR